MSTLDKPNQSSQAKSKKTAQDDRDFGDPNSLRGIIHTLEESRNNSDRRIDNVLSSIQQLAHLLETRQQPSQPTNRPQPTIEDADESESEVPSEYHPTRPGPSADYQQEAIPQLPRREMTD